MTDGIDQANENIQGQQNNGDRREQMTQAQDQVLNPDGTPRRNPTEEPTQDFRGIGENGTADLGDAGTVSGNPGT